MPRVRAPGILRGISRVELRGTEPAVAQEARKVGSFRAARGTKVCSPPRLPSARSRCRWSESGQWVWRTHWIPGVGAPGDLEGSLGLGSAAPSLRSLPLSRYDLVGRKVMAQQILS